MILIGLLIASLCLSSISGSSLSLPQVGPEHQPSPSVPSAARASAEQNNAVAILAPRCSAPVILEPGDMFSLHFTADAFTTVYAYLSTAYEPVVDEYWLSIDDVHTAEGGWVMNATVPAEVYPELYNVTILLDSNNKLFTATQPRAVSIVGDITDDFSFIHITDFHLGDPRGLAENIRETRGYKSLLRCIHEVNLLHPDFVIISGDLVYGQLYYKEYSREYPKIYEMLQRFDVPTYLCPGNHDGYRRIKEDGLEMWKQFFGPLHYSFDYGDFHFLSVNSFDFPARLRWTISVIPLNWGGSIQDEQLSWIHHDLLQSNAEHTFMFLHHSPLWDTRNESLLRMGYQNREALLTLIDQYDVDMVLAGHVHYDTAMVVNETIFVTTTTPVSNVCAEDSYWGYRLIRVEDGAVVSYNYKEPKYSIPSYQLEAQFPRESKAVVTNDLEMTTSVLLQFVLPDASYSVNQGTLVLERSNGLLKELYVQVAVPAQSEAVVELTQDSIQQ